MARLISVVDLEGEILARIRHLQNYLSNAGSTVKLIFPKNMCITLNRFDNVSNLRILELARAINGLYFKEFPIKLGNCLIYDAPKGPKTIHVQVLEGVDKLRMLAVKMNRLAVQAGFKPVKGGFNLHVKIAEVNTVKDQSILQAAVYRLLKVKVGGMNVETIKLKKETISEGEVEYETVHEVKAAGFTRFLPKSF